MNLGRIGHYHTPDPGDGSGTCQTSIVVKVWNKNMVNVVTWTHEGNQVTHTSVPVGLEPSIHASFHLCGDCPYAR